VVAHVITAVPENRKAIGSNHSFEILRCGLEKGLDFSGVGAKTSTGVFTGMP
jgi:hypothetical protein